MNLTDEKTCPIPIVANNLSETQLPTIKNVLEYLENLKEQKKLENLFDPSTSLLLNDVVKKLKGIWQQIGIVVVSDERMKKLLNNWHDKLKSIRKRFRARPNPNDTLLNDIKNFQKNVASLFDVAVCKCLPLKDCSCSEEIRVPEALNEFIIDQRSARIQYIQDLEEINVNQSFQPLKKKARTQKFKNKQTVENNDNALTEGADEFDPVPEVISSESDIVIMPNTLQMRTPLLNVAKMCVRYKVTPRKGGAVASAAIIDFINHHNIVIPKGCVVIDKNKMTREIKKVQTELPDVFGNGKLWALYFDGKRDKTLTNVKNTKTKSYHLREIVEEHITLVREPGSQFISYVSPLTGCAADVAATISEKFEELDAPLNTLRALGCDGTVVNTGNSGGILTLVENNIKKEPLHWFVCLLHLNELPLRHLIQYLYGAAAGPTSFCGIITKSLQSCDTMPVLKSFEAIKSNIPNNDNTDLRSDQKYFYEMLKAVSSGSCSEKLAVMKPGPMSLSRWLNTASRILRLYIATKNPTVNLKILVIFIMRVYGPCWFRIKKFKYVADGPKHLFFLIKESRYLDQKLRKVVNNVFQNNAFFAHSENVLLSMLADENKSIRMRAFEKIIEVRQRNEELPQNNVRKFIIPALNFDATDYTRMISWDETFEPPMTFHLSTEQLRHYVDHNEKSDPIFCFPCHTQSVERLVKDVSEVSKQTCNEKSRNANVHIKLKSRKILPKFDHKANFSY